MRVWQLEQLAAIHAEGRGATAFRLVEVRRLGETALLKESGELLYEGIIVRLYPMFEGCSVQVKE